MATAPFSKTPRSCALLSSWRHDGQDRPDKQTTKFTTPAGSPAWTKLCVWIACHARADALMRCVLTLTKRIAASEDDVVFSWSLEVFGVSDTRRGLACEKIRFFYPEFTLSWAGMRKHLKLTWKVRTFWSTLLFVEHFLVFNCVGTNP